MDPAVLRQFLNTEMLRSMKSVQQGGATTVWAAVSAEWKGKGGRKTAAPLTLHGYQPYLLRRGRSA